MSMIMFVCDNCGGVGYDKESHYLLKRKHFCKRDCYTEWRRNKARPDENNAWKGGISPEESRRNWRKKFQQKQRAMKEARMLREINAPGSHTKRDWRIILDKSGHKCAWYETGQCAGRLTKDHIIPLAGGGSQNPGNLQVLCSKHNSMKGDKIDYLPPGM